MKQEFKHIIIIRGINKMHWIAGEVLALTLNRKFILFWWHNIDF